MINTYYQKKCYLYFFFHVRKIFPMCRMSDNTKNPSKPLSNIYNYCIIALGIKDLQLSINILMLDLRFLQR
jgi:hypothetical protein